LNLRLERSKLAAIARREKADSVTPAEREAGKLAYQDYAARCNAIGASPESFSTYFQDWIDCHRAPDDPVVEVDRALARDYSQYYFAGPDSDYKFSEPERRWREVRKRALLPPEVGRGRRRSP
jgi:hypothetical protein